MSSHPRFLLNFDDGDSIWCNLDEVRRVPLRREQVGCMVWGRWSDGRYFLGRVTDVRDGKIHVTFDDGDNISHDLGDVSAVIVDLVPNPTHVPIGARVIAAFEGRCHYYKGRVTQIDSTNPYAPRYHVTYDDGDKGWVNCDKVRLLPMRADEVGARVYARWTNGEFYLGTVERVGHKIEIKYDDGDRIAHDPSDITAAVILDSTPNPGSVGRGTRVIAAWPGKEKYYLGTVDAVNKDQMYEPQYHVKYDDGDESWVTVNQLRVIPAPGPAPESQFMVVQIGADVVALNSIAHPHFYLGLEGGYLRGKWFDTYCHFYLREAPNQFMSLEACMLPGQHVGVDSKGSVMPPASVYAGTEPAMFEVKLLFSPYGQTYKANHSQGGYPQPGGQFPPGVYPQPGGQFPPGGYPQPGGQFPPGGYPQPGGQFPPGGYPQPGIHPPPEHGGYPPPGGYPGYGSAPPPY